MFHKGVVKIVNYGLQIGHKFNQDGSPRKYPGNTIISDVEPSNPAYPVIGRLRRILSSGELGKAFIFLPDDSYHVTIIRGVNDCVREPAYWPSALPLNTPMAAVDDYFEEHASKVTAPKQVHMKFDHVKIDAYDVRICLQPWDEAQDRELHAYRDQVADSIGLRLPGHDAYTYHITLAYVLWIPEGEQRHELEKRVAQMDAVLKEQSDFWLSEPKIRFYDDMLNFHTHRIPRT